MKPPQDQYEQYVEHPRFGKSPRITGLNPHGRTGSEAFLHWHSPKSCRIPNTAIVAKRSRHNTGLGYVTHYFDVTRQCVDCDRMFIFFAEEQRHWYETLQFNLSANCIRCTDCRKSVRDIKSLKLRYEQLAAEPHRSEEQQLELAELAILLVERAGFGRTVVELARACLNAIPHGSNSRKRSTFRQLSERSQRLLEESG